MNPRPLIGITMGDPVGIGPEIILTALAGTSVYEKCRPLVIGDPGVLGQAMAVAGYAPVIHMTDTPETGVYRPGTISMFSPAPPLSPVTWGEPTPETGGAMEAWITTAVDMAMAGAISAMVTCPINKEALKMAGSAFAGHTEMLAMRTGTNRYAMMLAGNRLRVVLVTIHTALQNVPGLLSVDAIADTILLTVESLKQRFGMNAPRVAVAGLNPHAGEGGLFGDEEARLITPAIEAARRKTEAAITGPWPPDTVFVKAAAGDFDAVVCMYHDQGLIPFKLLHFEDGVNTTLGLPIIRTSVDHGTAYDIAGTGRADCRSLTAAIDMAIDQAACLGKRPAA
ncbi:4-hydroxythreonine-4-phosphate dehydrogenase PdxA [Desulfosudis oleivorans]|uniref:4-hydroxythreonine-4-phosphate dehydrogenase n=1 Tax=Desulfosudis oleivorans (strain DSM 6200 / JCM 39069 / Hxd3) TaxID=96561 RepID=PDXA_DESOH|nr:4-hydroxythreonine-4-phosphate dehydrogenase PdxA [Desulfosudis oleivorans]A8ZUN0.1 RecName: Full=4-hydroxythreonine-4-phosphate dehydrogenase; AltName: Full=4-(phosphohydroxy)-L-threonine dehydrogenase [Desulfosudis oleivorans Hxd3]ABW66443.1 4-hydroxythreonine-4-phosphate dehydrogenase [Desulfosudis oleivorans Hxd3]